MNTDRESKQDGPDMRPPKHDSNGRRSRNPPSRPTWKSGPATKSSGTGSTLKGSSKRKRVKDEDEPTKTSPERTKLRREGKGVTAGDQRSRSPDQEASGAASSSRAVNSGKVHSGGGRHAHIGEKLQPGDGQRDYELTEPEPWRDDESCLHFDDQPTFLPTLSPEEIIRQGSFCGGYFRPIKSKKSGHSYKNDWKDLPAEWYSGLDLGTHLTHPGPPLPSLNRWKTKVGQTYEAWEDQGWIKPEHDCRGWFQWYCRFFRGRRCTDDDRQIGRWERLAGEKGGRWRRIYYGKYHKAGANEIESAEETISKGIRQTLNHWAYEPSTDHLMRYLEEKGEDVANDEGDLAQ